MGGCTCAPEHQDLDVTILHVHFTKKSGVESKLDRSVSTGMAAQAVEYFVLLTVAGTQPEDYEENFIVLFSWAVISKSRNQVGTI